MPRRTYYQSIYRVKNRKGIVIAEGTAEEVSEQLSISKDAVYCMHKRTKEGNAKFRFIEKIGEKVMEYA